MQKLRELGCACSGSSELDGCDFQALVKIGVEIGGGVQREAETTPAAAIAKPRQATRMKPVGETDASADAGVHERERLAALVEGEGGHRGGEGPDGGEKGEGGQTQCDDSKKGGYDGDKGRAADDGLPGHELRVGRWGDPGRIDFGGKDGTVVLLQVELRRTAVGAEGGGIAAGGKL